MSIKGITREQFLDVLKQYVSASGPIRTIEHLIGREDELQQIEEALYAEGRHIFIFGDRGVGKSSLAATAAVQYQSSDNGLIQVGCGPDTSFYQTVEEIAERVLKKCNGVREYTKEHSINLKVYSLKVKENNVEIVLPHVDSMFMAVEAMEEVAKYHSDTPVIVIDEFDQISSDYERGLFATFLKDLGDRGVNIKFIFTGVASSLNLLLGSNESSYRQLQTIRLPIIYWGYREEIIRQAIEALSLDIDDRVVFKITRLSNGFPYYIHLILEKLLWVVFNCKDEIEIIKNEHFEIALKNSILGINAQLLRSYNMATHHRAEDIYEIIWASADSESTERYTEKIYESYLQVHKQLHQNLSSDKVLPLHRTKVTNKLNLLKKESYGAILINHEKRRGLYSFRENILRGYVAMKALEAGVELRGDALDTPKTPTVSIREKKQYSAGDYVPLPNKYRGE